MTGPLTLGVAVGGTQQPMGLTPPELLPVLGPLVPVQDNPPAWPAHYESGLDAGIRRLVSEFNSGSWSNVPLGADQDNVHYGPLTMATCYALRHGHALDESVDYMRAALTIVRSTISNYCIGSARGRLSTYRWTWLRDVFLLWWLWRDRPLVSAEQYAAADAHTLLWAWASYATWANESDGSGTGTDGQWSSPYWQYNEGRPAANMLLCWRLADYMGRVDPDWVVPFEVSPLMGGTNPIPFNWRLPKRTSWLDCAEGMVFNVRRLVQTIADQQAGLVDVYGFPIQPGEYRTVAYDVDGSTPIGPPGPMGIIPVTPSMMPQTQLFFMDGMLAWELYELHKNNPGLASATLAAALADGMVAGMRRYFDATKNAWRIRSAPPEAGPEVGKVPKWAPVLNAFQIGPLIRRWLRLGEAADRDTAEAALQALYEGNVDWALAFKFTQQLGSVCGIQTVPALLTRP